jgi:hypothetical protein
MRRSLLPVALLVVALTAVPALAKTVGLTASPNPARVGERVRHDIAVGAIGRLDVWVSARGFSQPGSGTLPAGTWSYECCPRQTAGTPAWHYRSSSIVATGQYRFPATAQTRGTFLSTAAIGGATSRVWVSIR